MCQRITWRSVHPFSFHPVDTLSLSLHTPSLRDSDRERTHLFDGVRRSVSDRRTRFTHHSVLVHVSLQRIKRRLREEEGRMCRCYERQELKLEEIEVSLTLGGVGEDRVQGRWSRDGVDPTPVSNTAIRSRTPSLPYSV